MSSLAADLVQHSALAAPPGISRQQLINRYSDHVGKQPKCLNPHVNCSAETYPRMIKVWDAIEPEMSQKNSLSLKIFGQSLYCSHLSFCMFHISEAQKKTPKAQWCQSEHVWSKIFTLTHDRCSFYIIHLNWSWSKLLVIQSDVLYIFWWPVL
jgi:hypothetical protein